MGNKFSDKSGESSAEDQTSIDEKQSSHPDTHAKIDIHTTKEFQSRYEYVINNISEIIFQTDKDGSFTFLSSVWEKVTGFTFQESIGSNLFDFIHDNDKEGFRREYYDLLSRDEGNLIFEARIRTGFREYIWTEIQMQVTYSPERILLGTTGTISDIDSKKKNFSELQYRLMFERIIMDISTELMNFEPEELEPKIFHSLRLLCEISGFDYIYLSLFSNDYSVVENSFIWELNTGKAEKQGSRFLSESSDLLRRLLNLETIFDNSGKDADLLKKNERGKSGTKNTSTILIIPLVFNKLLIGFMGLDSAQVLNKYDNERLSLLRTGGEIIVSAYKRMEIQKALIESENNYSSVVNNIREVIFKLNSTGEWVFLNRAWKELTGFGHKESLSVSFLLFIFPEDRPKNLDYFKTAINKKSESVRYETRMITRSGNYKWIEIYMKAVSGKADDEWISGTIADITERKRSETLQKALYEIAVLTAGFHTSDKFYSSLHNIFNDLMDAQNFCFILLDSQKEELSFPYFVNSRVEKPAPRAIGNGLLDLVFKKHDPLLITKENRHQIIRESDLEYWEKGVIDFLGIPLIRDLQIVGAIAIYNYDENIRFTENHLDILTTLAQHIINALGRIQLA